MQPVREQKTLLCIITFHCFHNIAFSLCSHSLTWCQILVSCRDFLKHRKCVFGFFGINRRKIGSYRGRTDKVKKKPREAQTSSEEKEIQPTQFHWQVMSGKCRAETLQQRELSTKDGAKGLKEDLRDYISWASFSLLCLRPTQYTVHDFYTDS